MRHLIARVLSFLSLFVVALLMPSYTHVNATVDNEGTEVQGVINVDTVWSAEGSPYTITEFIHVAEGVTLTIEPGVTVQGERSRIDVWGSIRATGSENNPVYFKSVTLATRSNLASTELLYVDAEFRNVSLYGKIVIAYSVIRSIWTLDVRPSNDSLGQHLCQVTSNTIRAPLSWFYIVPGEGTKCTVTDNFFYQVDTSQSNRAGLCIGDDISRLNGDVDFHSNYLLNAGLCISRYDGANPVHFNIRHNVFHNSGIGIAYVNPEGTTIEIGANAFIQGVTAIDISQYADDAEVNINHNLFAYQERAIVDVEPSNPELTVLIEYNNFENERENVFRYTGSSPLDARNNYWGSTDSTRIAEMIFDRNDSLNSPNFVTFDPYLDLPDPNTPTWHMAYLPTILLTTSQTR